MVPSDSGQVHDDDLKADDDENCYENVSDCSKVVDAEQLGQQ